DMCGIAGRCITGANSRLLRFAATGHEILGKGDLLRGQVGARRGKRVHWAGNSWAEVTVIRAASRGLWNRFQRTDERGSRVYSPGGGRSKSRRAYGAPAEYPRGTKAALFAPLEHPRPALAALRGTPGRRVSAPKLGVRLSAGHNCPFHSSSARMLYCGC